MANISLKCFGVYRLDSNIKQIEIDATDIRDVFSQLNKLAQGGNSITYSQSLVYIDGELCKSKRKELNNGQEVWIFSSASGVKESA